jgi:hypothetical protein
MNNYWIGAALLATLAAVYFAPDPDADSDAVSMPVRAASSGSSAGARAGAASVGTAADARLAGSRFDLRIQARDEEGEPANLFGTAPAAAAALPTPVASAKVQKVKSGPPPPPPRPQAPPLPFQFRGRWVDEGKVAYFLQYQQRNLVLQPGDIVDQTWKLEQVSAGQLTFVYLPLNQKQSLAAGEVN